MKNILYFFVLLLFVSAWSVKQQNITGKFSGTVPGDKVYLYQYKVGDIDSAIIAEDGTFGFDFIPQKMDLYGFRLKDNSDLSFFMNKGDGASFTGDIKDIDATTICTGSKDAIASINFSKKLHEFESAEKHDYKEKNMFIKNFIDENQDRMINVFAISRLSSDDSKSYYEKVLKSLNKIAPEHPMVRRLSSNLSEGSLFPGDICPNIILADTSGTMVNLDSVAMKLTLIDFWGSFCVPCRKLHPKLKEVYNTYHSKGFEILAISSDKNEDRWKKAILSDGINWLQVIDTKGTSKNFGIIYLPFNYLIDQNRRIIARNVSEEQLVEILKEKL